MNGAKDAFDLANGSKNFELWMLEMLEGCKMCKMLQGCKTLDNTQPWEGGRLLLRFRTEWLLQTRRKKHCEGAGAAE